MDDLKEKTVNARKKMSENLTEHEADDAGQISIFGNTSDSQQSKNQKSKNRKRKADAEEQSENNASQEKTENNGGVGATNVQDSEKNRSDSGKVKSARKERSEKISGQKKEVGSKTVDGNTRNNKEKKRDSVASSTGKATVHPPISEMVQDSFKSLKKRNGTSAEEICKYVDENFQVNINRIRLHIMYDSAGDEKFKVKKTEKVNSKNGKTKMAKDEKRVGKVKKVPPRVRKETQKVARKAKNEKKVKPKDKVIA